MCVLLWHYLIGVDWSGNGVDYTSTPINATFTAGTISTTINVPVTRDNIAEESETFNLGLNVITSLSGRVTPGGISASTVTITDDTSKILICIITKYLN